MGVSGIADRPVIVVSNPAAGNGAGMRFAHKLVDGLEAQGADISWEITRRNPAQRVEGLIDVLKRSDPANAPIVIVCAGDGTAADVCQAIHAVQTDEFRPTLVPGPGGTAADMHRELGVPRSPAGMLRFLASAQPVELDVVTASNDGGPERLILHSSGNGVSGAFFTQVDGMRQETGRTSIPTYLRALASGVAAAEVFSVRIDGGEPLPVGEVFTGVNSTSMGGVTRIPLPIGGARVHAIPLDPSFWGPFRAVPGLPPLLDSFWRGALFMAGDWTAIAPGAAIAHLPADRMRDVMPGERVRLEFFDADGRPKRVLSVANGDPAGPTSSVVIRHTGEKISALAAADSAYRIRQGLVRPTTLVQRMLAGAQTAAQRGTPALLLSSFSGLEVYEDVAAAFAVDGEGSDEATAAALNPFDIEVAPGVLELFCPAGALPALSAR